MFQKRNAPINRNPREVARLEKNLASDRLGGLTTCVGERARTRDSVQTKPLKFPVPQKKKKKKTHKRNKAERREGEAQ